MVPEWVQASTLTGVVTGLVFYGAVTVHLKWLHSNLKTAFDRIETIDKRLYALMVDKHGNH